MPLTRRCRSISRKGSTVPIDYRLVRSRRRSLELRIYPDRRIEVRAPLRCPQRDIDMFVSSRKNWIEKKLQVLPEYQGTPAAKRYVDGSTHYFFGEPLTLALRAGRGKALLNDGVLQLAVSDPEDAEMGRASCREGGRSTGGAE